MGWKGLALALLIAAPAAAQPVVTGVGGNPPVAVSAGGGCLTGCTFNGTTTLGGPLTWSTGLGAITHVLGPSDQDLKITAGNSTAAQLNLGTGSGASLTTSGGATVNGSTVNLNVAASTIEQVAAGGIRLLSASQPTVSSCGTGSVTNGSTNNGGEVTATGATSCTVNFTSTPYATVVFCAVEEETTLGSYRISAISTSAFTVTGLTAGDKFMYICFGK